MSQTQSTSILPDPSRKVTYEAFLEGAWGTEHVEWVDGEVKPMSPVTAEHDDICGFLIAVLRPYVEAKKLGAIRQDPFQMKTGPNLPGRAPDVMFISNVNAPKLRKTYLDGPADLVIEVISPGSVAVDRGEKFEEYEQGGVREYWLIDPLRHQAQFYSRGQDGLFRLMPVEAGRFASEVLGALWLKVGWLWDRPEVIGVLKGWDLV